MLDMQCMPASVHHGTCQNVLDVVTSVMSASSLTMPHTSFLRKLWQCAEGNTWPEAFGRILGTFLVASLLELFLAFIPPRQLSKIAPPIITGLGIALPGLDLIGAGLKCGQSFSLVCCRLQRLTVECRGTHKCGQSFTLACCRLQH